MKKSEIKNEVHQCYMLAARLYGRMARDDARFPVVASLKAKLQHLVENWEK